MHVANRRQPPVMGSFTEGHGETLIAGLHLRRTAQLYAYMSLLGAQQQQLPDQQQQHSIFTFIFASKFSDNFLSNNYGPIYKENLSFFRNYPFEEECRGAVSRRRRTVQRMKPHGLENFLIYILYKK